MTATIDHLRQRAAAATFDDPWADTDLAEQPPGQPRGDQAEPDQRTAPRRTGRAPYVLTRRKPRAGQTWPYIMIAGGEFSGKSYAVAELAATGKFGQVDLLAIGENPEQYQEIADYDIVTHDGSYYQIAAAVDQLHAEADREPLVDGKPRLLWIDSGSKLWELISDIAELRACKSDEAREALMRNPYATVNIGPLGWTKADKMWRRITTKLITMKAVVVMTARAKDNVAISKAGQPDNTKPKVFKPAVQSQAPYETSMYVRVDREQPPTILGARLPRGGVRPGVDRSLVFDGQPRELDGGKTAPPLPPFSLDYLLFGVLRFDPLKAIAAQIVDPNAPADADEPVSAPPAPAGATEPAGAGPSPGDVAPATRHNDYQEAPRG